ncbi:MAG: prepilin-type N-terminal cleavage/methylation domain-containing protein [Bacillota bacterium]|nr:prepilin-type N-terminal cleavage/methylation domain-containing protein [Bacillota bacterium]
MKKSNKGFTLAELLIVVAIIAVLVAIAIPVFTSQLEKSREATDLANVRGAYAQVMNAAIVEDTSSPLYSNGLYYLSVPLKQAQDNWQMNKDTLTIGGIPSSDSAHWKGAPKAHGSCKVYCSDGEIILYWGKEDHINRTSAADFLTEEILTKILGDYNHTVINSNEPESQNEGTKKFLEYAREHGFDLAEDYGAATWQIYVKDPNSKNILSKPAIYWSTLELSADIVGKSIPVMGYRDGKYDVYYAQVVKNNEGKPNEYITIRNNFANVTEAGGSASFQFTDYAKAKEVYDKILTDYNDKVVLNSALMKKYGLDK